MTAAPEAHVLQRNPVGVAEQIAGSASTGSHSCSCGGWSANLLDNRAGAEAAKSEHRQHLTDVRRARIEAIAERLYNLDYDLNLHDLQHAIDDAVSDLREANAL